MSDHDRWRRRMTWSSKDDDRNVVDRCGNRLKTARLCVHLQKRNADENDSGPQKKKFTPDSHRAAAFVVDGFLWPIPSNECLRRMT